MKIDMAELGMALTVHHPEVDFYLDKETGEIILETQDVDLDEELDKEELSQHPDRYLHIEPIDSRTGYRIMEDFVFNLPDGPAKELLERALSWKKPFSNFKSALHEFPELRKDWDEHYEKRVQKNAREWLIFHEIEVENVTGKE